MLEQSSILAIGFVTPAFALAGGLLVSIPIVIHLLNRRRYRTVEWAAMDFLLRAMRKNRRRIRFEQWLLLAVRCLVLGLLGLALARPLGCEDASIAALAAQRTGLHVIVIDNSYSMLYEADRPDARTHLDQAKLLAKNLIDRFSGGGESVAVITTAQPAAAVVAQPVFDPQVAKNAVDRIEQTYAATDIPGALDLAAKLGRDELRQPNKTLYLFTDSTRSAWLVPGQEQTLAYAGRDLKRHFQTIVHFDLAKPSQWNAAVTDVRPGSSLLRLGYLNSGVATVRGYGATQEGALQWRLDDQILPGSAAVRPEPDTNDITRDLRELTRGGPHVLAVTFAGDDRLKIDDTRHHIIDVASDMKVLIVEGERSAEAMGGSGAFLMEALVPSIDQNPASGTQRRPNYLAPERVSDLELGNKVLADYRAVILAGVGQVSTNQADQLKAFVEGGGTLMMFMGVAVNPDSYNGVLLPRGLLPGPLAKRIDAGAQQAFYFDFKPNAPLHPLLRKFANQSNTGLERAQTWTYWQIDLPQGDRERRVLDYQTRPADAAITVHPLGAGQVLFVSTSADTKWTALPGRLNFAPLLHELLSGTMSSGESWMNLTVGDELRIPAWVQLAGAPTLKDAQGVEIAMEPSTTAGQTTYRSRRLTKPGLYALTTGVTKLPVAVNVPADEADIRPLDNAGIRKALGDVDIEFERDQLPPVVARAEAGNDFGWAVMMVLLAMVALECFLAMKFGHYKRA